jgi:hypothetical protein
MYEIIWSNFENKHNARLMAAAPSMHDALTRTLALLQDGDAEAHQADALEALIADILLNLEN